MIEALILAFLLFFVVMLGFLSRKYAHRIRFRRTPTEVIFPTEDGITTLGKAVVCGHWTTLAEAQKLVQDELRAGILEEIEYKKGLDDN